MEWKFRTFGGWSRTDKASMLVWATLMVVATAAALLLGWSIDVQIVIYVVLTLTCSSVELVGYVKARHYGAALFWFL